MQFEKLFVIGFNKTATSTFHVLFQKNGLQSQHDGSRWDVEDYQCFSDNGNLREWRRFIDDYGSAVFVLNTRPIGAWIRSRAKHCYIEELSWGYPPAVDLYSRWILERNNYHWDVIRLFQDIPDRLVIVDISQPQWLDFLCELLNLEYFDLEVNAGSREVPPEHLLEVERVMHRAMDDLSIPIAERHSPFLMPSLLSSEDREAYVELYSRYRNNFSYGTRGASQVLHELKSINDKALSASVRAGLRILESKIGEIEARYQAVEKKAAELTEQTEADAARLMALEAALRKAETELADVYQSSSWRITSPFRTARELLRGRRLGP